MTSPRRAASLETLARRAEMFARIRAFFAARGVLEVETPMLSRSGISDPAIDAWRAQAPGFDREALYLRTSPEYSLKRLLAAGSGDIYELGRVFRDGETGRWHEPEFTMLEWYRVGWDEHALADEAVELIGELVGGHGERPHVNKVVYSQVFEAALGVQPAAEAGAIAGALERAGVAPPADYERDGLLDLALSTVVASSFEPRALTVVHAFPASQAALAEIDDGDPPTAARFEIFFEGIELANGYRELCDAAEQRARFEAELERRCSAARHAPPLDEAFLADLARMPRAAGVSIGVDRLLALTLGFEALAPALAFTHGPI